jgi:hypothetical protein
MSSVSISVNNNIGHVIKARFSTYLRCKTFFFNHFVVYTIVSEQTKHQIE